MAANLTRIDFITRARRLAYTFINASDSFNALAAELANTSYLLPEADGGFSADDFSGQHSDISAADLLAFVQTMQALLQPLTPEQKASIYKVKSTGSGTPLPF